jgi:hypothetical protein
MIPRDTMTVIIASFRRSLTLLEHRLRRNKHLMRVQVKELKRKESSLITHSKVTSLEGVSVSFYQTGTPLTSQRDQRRLSKATERRKKMPRVARPSSKRHYCSSRNLT